ncbi:hypothetical protein FQR65_LT13337 [Abscondita terminalis]|nr:hypothetical protein FQR65_LT13337 [Abscondita terminalis]
MRRFPGPAGLIKPDNSGNNTEKLNDVCSENDFAEEPWNLMLKDFKVLNERNVYLPDRYNIAWVTSMAKDDKLPNQKTPFLAGCVVKINTKTPIVTLTLKDKTGEINGVIVNALYEECREVLTVGTVIVLKQIGVLTIGSSNSYLTITANNLMRIYNDKGVVILRHCNVNDFISTNEGATVRSSDVPKDDKGDVSLSVEDEAVLHSVFDGIDADLLFDDF